MKGIYFDGQRAAYREDLEMPKVRQGESLIKLLMAAVCNTDKEIGCRPDFRGVMGHEFVGIVEVLPTRSCWAKSGGRAECRLRTLHLLQNRTADLPIV